MVKVAPTPTVRSAVIQATEQRLQPLELTHPLTPRVSAERGAPKAPRAQAGALDPVERNSAARSLLDTPRQVRHASEREARCAVGFGRSERVDPLGRHAVQVPRWRTG
jgi:hypothetical protein